MFYSQNLFVAKSPKYKISRTVQRNKRRCAKHHKRKWRHTVSSLFKICQFIFSPSFKSWRILDSMAYLHSNKNIIRVWKKYKLQIKNILEISWMASAIVCIRKSKKHTSIYYGNSPYFINTLNKSSKWKLAVWKLKMEICYISSLVQCPLLSSFDYCPICSLIG